MNTTKDLENVLYHYTAYCGDIETYDSWWYRIDFDDLSVSRMFLSPNEPVPFDEEDPDTDYHQDWYAIQQSMSFLDWNVPSDMKGDLLRSVASKHTHNFMTEEEGCLERDDVESLLKNMYGQ